MSGEGTRHAPKGSFRNRAVDVIARVLEEIEDDEMRYTEPYPGSLEYVREKAETLIEEAILSLVRERR